MIDKRNDRFYKTGKNKIEIEFKGKPVKWREYKKLRKMEKQQKEILEAIKDTKAKVRLGNVEKKQKTKPKAIKKASDLPENYGFACGEDGCKAIHKEED